MIAYHASNIIFVSNPATTNAIANSAADNSGVIILGIVCVLIVALFAGMAKNG